MTEFRLVMGAPDGKSYQKEVKGPEAEALLRKRIGDTVSGDALGLSGYEFQVTGGSDKCGFPMRKGIQQPRKRVLIGRSVGFKGYDRHGHTQPGLSQRTTVCGEMVTKIIHQVNLRVTKPGKEPLVHTPAEKK